MCDCTTLQFAAFPKGRTRSPTPGRGKGGLRGMAGSMPLRHSSFGTATSSERTSGRLYLLFNPLRGGGNTSRAPASRASFTGRDTHTGELCQAGQKGKFVAARTIPFPPPPGNAATATITSPPPPPLPPPGGAAKLATASRRYRGLHLVRRDPLFKRSLHLNRLAQTQAIVAQVEREMEERTRRERKRRELMLLAPVQASRRSLAGRAAYRVIASLFPAGL